MTKFCPDAPTWDNLLTKVSVVDGYKIEKTYGGESVQKDLFDKININELLRTIFHNSFRSSINSHWDTSISQISISQESFQAS